MADKQTSPKSGNHKHILQRRGYTRVDHLRPQRWNWSALVRPLDERLAHQADDTLPPERVFSLRYFWLDGFFSAISENFYLGFVTLYALAYGATNGQVGWVTAVANLAGAIALFPGARLAEGQSRKRLVVWSGGGIARLALVGLALVPLLTGQAGIAIWLIILLNGLRAFMGNLANPAWTAMIADLVPDFVRGRYFGSRNMAMGAAALVVAPLAGRLIQTLNGRFAQPFSGYQSIFLLAFIFGMMGTFSFNRIVEPAPKTKETYHHHRGDLRRVLRQNRVFVGMIISAFVWNLSLQVAAPFFNVYLVEAFGASTGMIGFLAAVSSLMALVGQRVFGRLLDQKGAFWVQRLCGFLIPLLPLGWVFITAPWQVSFINLLGGFVWAGYNLSNFNLLLAQTPEAERPRAVALYQTAVFSSAVIGPLLGGYLADAVSFRLIFGLSCIGRLAGMLIFVWFWRQKE
jgi:MFS family permease